MTEAEGAWRPDPTGRFDSRLQRGDGTWTEKVTLNGAEQVDPWEVASANPRPVAPWPAGSRYCVWCTRGAVPGETACSRCGRPLFGVTSAAGAPAGAPRRGRVGRSRIRAAVAGGIALCVIVLAVVLLVGRDPKKDIPTAAVNTPAGGRADAAAGGATPGGVPPGGGDRVAPARRAPTPRGTPPGGGGEDARQACLAYQAVVKDAMAGTSGAEANPKMQQAVATMHRSATEAARLNPGYENLAQLAGLVVAGEPEGPAILKECSRLGF